jgi:hypothetical protein|tara:strand:- start:2676 stop:2849 length:174 start_codon:yes stop_codon:yes gene_type:complete
MEQTSFFLHSKNPSPVMLAAMESYQRQIQAEHEYRQAVRAGRIQPETFTTLNISDRH